MKKRLSIVILNHNTEKLLEQCLRSLPGHADFQIIVVDNASTDDSVAMVQKEFPGVEIIRSKTNGGYTRGNNLARKKAIGDYVLFLNSDTEVYPNTLETMVKFMDGHPDAGIATCLVELPNGRLYYASHRGFPTPWNSLLYFLGLPSNYHQKPGNTIHEIDACSGTFLLIRKKLLDQIGWFDEDYFSYGEDIEMCYRVKELGYKVYFVPDVKIMHYWGASSGLKSTSRNVAVTNTENSKKWNEARYQAMKIFYDKHYREQYPEIVRALVFFAVGVINHLRKGRD